MTSFEAPRLEERASGPLAAQKRCKGAGAAPARNRPLEAGSRWAWWRAVMVGGGGGRTGEERCGARWSRRERSGGAGAAQAGNGLLRTLLERWRQEGGE
jgi:hypothetical protein